MNARRRAGLAGLAAAAVLTAVGPPLGAADIFKARMFTGKAPIEPPLVDVRIEVEAWTTPEEIRQLQDVLNQAGTEPFLNAFQRQNKGVVRFMYSRGWNLTVHAAVSYPTAKGKEVFLFLLRQNWDPGARFGSSGRNHFMVIKLTLNAKGKGEGRFYEDAQITMDAALGRMELESYESVPKIFPQVQEVVKKSPGS